MAHPFTQWIEIDSDSSSSAPIEVNDSACTSSSSGDDDDETNDVMELLTGTTKRKRIDQIEDDNDEEIDILLGGDNNPKQHPLRTNNHVDDPSSLAFAKKRTKKMKQYAQSYDVKRLMAIQRSRRSAMEPLPLHLQRQLVHSTASIHNINRSGTDPAFTALGSLHSSQRCCVGNGLSPLYQAHWRLEAMGSRFSHPATVTSLPRREAKSKEKKGFVCQEQFEREAASCRTLRSVLQFQTVYEDANRQKLCCVNQLEVDHAEEYFAALHQNSSIYLFDASDVAETFRRKSHNAARNDSLAHQAENLQIEAEDETICEIDFTGIGIAPTNFKFVPASAQFPNVGDCAVAYAGASSVAMFDPNMCGVFDFETYDIDEARNPVFTFNGYQYAREDGEEPVEVEFGLGPSNMTVVLSQHNVWGFDPRSKRSPYWSIRLDGYNNSRAHVLGTSITRLGGETSPYLITGNSRGEARLFDIRNTKTECAASVALHHTLMTDNNQSVPGIGVVSPIHQLRRSATARDTFYAATEQALFVCRAPGIGSPSSVDGEQDSILAVHDLAACSRTARERQGRHDVAPIESPFSPGSFITTMPPRSPGRWQFCVAEPSMTAFIPNFLHCDGVHSIDPLGEHIRPFMDCVTLPPEGGGYACVDRTRSRRRVKPGASSMGEARDARMKKTKRMEGDFVTAASMAEVGRTYTMTVDSSDGTKRYFPYTTHSSGDGGLSSTSSGCGVSEVGQWLSNSCPPSECEDHRSAMPYTVVGAEPKCQPTWREAIADYATCSAFVQGSGMLLCGTSGGSILALTV